MVKELCNNKYLLNLFALIIVPLFCISCSSEVSVDILKKEKSRQPDHFYIESQNDGQGIEVLNSNLFIGESISLYSIERDDRGDFVGNMPVSWASSGGVGNLTIALDGKSALFTPVLTGQSIVSISVNNKVVKTIKIEVGHRDLTVSNLQLSSIQSDGFDISVDVDGGSGSKSITAYYCNQTVSPGCDPLVGNQEKLVSSGGTYIGSITGLVNPMDFYNITVESVDSVPVIGSQLSASIQLGGSSLGISNISSSAMTSTGFTINVDFVGDSEVNGSVTLYYCNETDSPGCDPLLGTSLLMSRGVSDFSITVAGLSAPNNEGDEINISVIASDPDGTNGSPLTTNVFLADLQIRNLNVTDVTDNDFNVKVDFIESDSDGSVVLYYCNETDLPGCDPLSGSSIAMNRLSSTFEVDVVELMSPNDFGDELNIQVAAIDPDGAVSIGNLTKTFKLVDFALQDPSFHNITQTTFNLHISRTSNGETNNNVSVLTYWCNRTDNPSCDPLVSGNVYTSEEAWQAWSFAITDLVADPGDEISVALEVIDVDGFSQINPSNLSYSAVYNLSFIVPNPKDIFRSVGPGQTLPLVTSTTNGGNLTITGSTLSFTNPILDQNGVGDALFYDSSGDGNIDNVAFITERISNGQYRLSSFDGGAPIPVFSSSVWKIYRAYDSLASAASGSENSGIIADSDLAGLQNFDTWVEGKDISAQTGSDENWNFALYAGNQADIGPVHFKENKWIKDKGNYINIFTVDGSNHVGVSQRHSGVWSDNHYRLEGNSGNVLYIETNRTVVRGLQIEVTGNSGNTTGIYSRNNSEGLYEKNIIKSTSSGSANKAIRFYNYSQIGPDRSLFLNNIIYNFDTLNSYAFLVEWQKQTDQSARLYNNTFYNNYNSIETETWRSTHLVNNIIITGLGTSLIETGGWYSIYNNIFNDDLVTSQTANNKAGNLTNISASSIFVDINNEDFRLIPGAIANDSGRDMTVDYNEDIIGTTRNLPFDIGAFEY